MNNAGTFTLASLGITAALSAQAQTAITDLDGMTAVTLEAAFQYGSGGTTCVVVIQTSFDGSVYLDIARFDFTQSSGTKVANLSGLLSKAVAAYTALGAEGVNDGVLADNLRAVITSTGTYSNTTLSVRAAVR